MGFNSYMFSIVLFITIIVCIAAAYFIHKSNAELVKRDLQDKLDKSKEDLGKIDEQIQKEKEKYEQYKNQIDVLAKFIADSANNEQKSDK